MKRLCCAVGCSVLLSWAGLLAQSGTSESPWTFEVAPDKLTDKPTLTATTSVMLSAQSPYVYQLEMKCDGSTPKLTLGTFDAVVANSGVMQPRPIRWSTSALGQLNTFRYRADDKAVDMAFLSQIVANVGNVHTMELVETPARRLVIADVFPNETVEISFARLSATERDAMNRMCFGIATSQSDASPSKDVGAAANDVELISGVSEEYSKCLASTDTNADWSACATAELDRQEKQLTKAWDGAAAATKENSAESFQRLLDEQRAWIRYKDAACRYFSLVEFGRESQVLHFGICKARVIAHRVGELESLTEFLNQ